MTPNKTPTEIEKLKEPKLLWKGTTAEAIRLGKITQEEVDRWDMTDEYDEGFKEGQQEERDKVLKIMKKYDFIDEKTLKRLNKLSKEDKNGKED